MDYKIIQPIISRVLQSGHDGEFHVEVFLGFVNN